MLRVLKFNCECNTSTDKLDDWEGYGVLFKDGWFEGVINNDQKEDILIFGCYLAQKRVQIFKLISGKVNDKFIFHFYPTKGKKMKGFFHTINFTGKSILGKSTIVIEDDSRTTSEIKETIKRCKKKLDEKNKAFYAEALKCRVQIIQAIQLEGSNF